MINEANTSNDVVEQPNFELDGRTTTGIFKKNCTHQCVSLLTQMHSPYVGVAHVINETNTSNGVVEHLTSELNERITDDFDDFDDSWLHHNDTFQTIPMECTSTLYKAHGIVNYSYYSWIICIVSIH